MSRRNLKYIKEKNKESGQGFFNEENLKQWKNAIMTTIYSPFIDTTYLKIRHDGGYLTYKFLESGELEYFAGDYVRKEFKEGGKYYEERRDLDGC